MNMKITACVVSVLHLTLANYDYSEQPSYQVSILLEMSRDPGNPIHLCNGDIISEKLILTTADCVHLQFGHNGKKNKLDASVISVYAGSTNSHTVAFQVNVTTIEIAKNFQPITLENDIALLILSQSLPLGTRSDIRWIMLGDNSHVNSSCLINFFSKNKKDAIPDYYQTEELNILNNELCRNSTKYPYARRLDICSIYVLPHQFDCPKVDSFLSFNNDRGTGLVCKNFLVGLLSSIVTRPDPANMCTDITLRAIYTNIYPHLRWIYSIMSTLETEYISTPYDASLKPLLVNYNPVNMTSAFNSSSMANNSTKSLNAINSTMSTHILPNSTIVVYSTLMNSMFVILAILTNVTANLNNSTNRNTTVIYPTIFANNHTINLVTTNTRPALTIPVTKARKPVIQNIFKNNGVWVRLSSGILLIIMVHLLTSICQ